MKAPIYTALSVLFLSISLVHGMENDTIDDTNEDTSYIQKAIRWGSKVTGTLNPDELAGIGNDKNERTKTKLIIRNYYADLATKGRSPDNSQFCSRLLPIVMASEKIISDLIQVNKKIQKPLNQDELRSEILSTLARAELLAAVQEAMPMGMAKVFAQQKALAETNLESLKSSSRTSLEHKRTSKNTSTLTQSDHQHARPVNHQNTQQQNSDSDAEDEGISNSDNNGNN